MFSSEANYHFFSDLHSEFGDKTCATHHSPYEIQIFLEIEMLVREKGEVERSGHHGKPYYNMASVQSPRIVCFSEGL